MPSYAEQRARLRVALDTGRLPHDLGQWAGAHDQFPERRARPPQRGRPRHRAGPPQRGYPPGSTRATGGERGREACAAPAVAAQLHGGEHALDAHQGRPGPPAANWATGLDQDHDGELDHCSGMPTRLGPGHRGRGLTGAANSSTAARMPRTTAASSSTAARPSTSTAARPATSTACSAMPTGAGQDHRPGLTAHAANSPSFYAQFFAMDIPAIAPGLGFFYVFM